MKILNKANRVFPALYIGSAFIGGAFLLKLLSAVMKISLKLFIFDILDSLIIHVGGVLALLGMCGTYLINSYIKKNSRIKLNSEETLLFFSKTKENEHE